DRGVPAGGAAVADGGASGGGLLADDLPGRAGVAVAAQPAAERGQLPVREQERRRDAGLVRAGDGAERAVGRAGSLRVGVLCVDPRQETEQVAILIEFIPRVTR